MTNATNKKGAVNVRNQRDSSWGEISSYRYSYYSYTTSLVGRSSVRELDF